MGAFADYADLKAGVEQSPNYYGLVGNDASISGEAYSTYGYTGITTAAALYAANSTAAIAPRLPSTMTAQLWLTKAEIAPLALNPIYLIDRLSHQGGLSGIVTSAQTTNLPTAALPRYTGGDGVCIGIQIYTAVGATNTTLTCSYTNQAGTAGRTTLPISFGGSGRNSAANFFILPLADGDTGCRSVQSVTIAASTGIAGSFGIVLFKPLALAAPSDYTTGGQTQSYSNMLSAGKLIEVIKDACLTCISKLNGTIYISSAVLTIAER